MKLLILYFWQGNDVDRRLDCYWSVPPVFNRTEPVNIGRSAVSLPTRYGAVPGTEGHERTLLYSEQGITVKEDMYL